MKFAHFVTLRKVGQISKSQTARPDPPLSGLRQQGAPVEMDSYYSFIWLNLSCGHGAKRYKYQNAKIGMWC